MSDAEEPTFVVQAIYGARPERGLVEVALGSEVVVVEPAKAREMAAFLVDAAGYAEGEEALMEVLARSGMSEWRALEMLTAVRLRRDVIEHAARDEARRSAAEDRLLPDLPEW